MTFDFGPAPRTRGEAVATQPRILGFYPGPERCGWLATRGGRVVAVGTAMLDYVDRPAFVDRFTSELRDTDVDVLVVTGPPDTVDQLATFAEAAVAAGTAVDLVEVHGAEHRRVRPGHDPGPWRATPPPPLHILAAGYPEPALTWTALTERYELATGPGVVEDAPRLTHTQKATLDRLTPRTRHNLALRTLDILGATRGPLDGIEVARLAYLLTDPIVRSSLAHECVQDRGRVDTMVQAHRVAHIEDGAALRSATAALVYATSPTPTLADWIAEASGNEELSEQVRQLIQHATPSTQVRAIVQDPAAMASLAAADDAWIGATLTPLPDRVRDLAAQLDPPRGPEPPRLPPPNPGPTITP
ncbi:hypothetical protein [Miniimonas sp. S16]|uniref:hypothetical protein n=1 Tax=Miniimonas sp. S16 TaxID=2171623 RepID=UPI000D52807A|nr:hypothetical protein [Miniimonas sp. S16]